MKSLLTAWLLLLLPIISLCAGVYDGEYILAGILDAKGNSIPLPVSASTSTGSFTMSMTSSDSKDEEMYNINLHISNMIGCSMIVTGGNQITIKGIISTQMMPAPEVYQLEQTLISMLPATQSIYRNSTKHILMMNSVKGTIVFQDQ